MRTVSRARETMLSLAGTAVRSCRSALGLSAESLTDRRSLMRRYRLPIVAVILAGALAGCAAGSEQQLSFFKAYAPGQVESRHLGMHVISVSQTNETLAPPKAGGRLEER